MVHVGQADNENDPRMKADLKCGKSIRSDESGEWRDCALLVISSTYAMAWTLMSGDESRGSMIDEELLLVIIIRSLDTADLTCASLLVSMDTKNRPATTPTAPRSHHESFSCSTANANKLPRKGCRHWNAATWDAGRCRMAHVTT